MRVNELARGPQDHGQDTLEQLLIPATLLTQIAEYCKVDRKFERCGLIGGRGEQAFTFYPTANIAEDAASRAWRGPPTGRRGCSGSRAATTGDRRRSRRWIPGLLCSRPSGVMPLTAAC